MNVAFWFCCGSFQISSSHVSQAISVGNLIQVHSPYGYFIFFFPHAQNSLDFLPREKKNEADI